jgi:tetratricopeptide (TPR) repeat protein
LLFVLALVALGVPIPALAQRTNHTPTATREEPPPPPPPPAPPAAQTEDQLKAQQHFNRAKELYQQGAYREAIAELEIARALDPKAKELVFNLGLLHEKLAKFDEAIAWYQKHLEMDLTPQERAKTESIIKRIEGAKAQVPTPTTTASPTAPPPQRPPPERGRVDTATIAAGSVAVVALGVGTYFGINAVASRPNDFVTGRDGSYATLVEKTDDAHTSAIVADVAIGIAVVATIATLYLYFGRTKDAPVARTPFPFGGSF